MNSASLLGSSLGLRLPGTVSVLVDLGQWVGAKPVKGEDDKEERDHVKGGGNHRSGRGFPGVGWVLFVRVD